jgi:Ulp1 family protease
MDLYKGRVLILDEDYYDNYRKHGYETVKRRTRPGCNRNHAERDFIFDIPEVLFLILYGKKSNSGHYGLFRISFEHKQMTYYDSLGWKNPELYNKMWELLNLESLDKLQSPFNYDGWRRMEPVDLPKQAAGSNDCGIFAMLFARDIAREGIISFNSSEALLARHQFAYEMLLYEPVATAKPKQQYPIKVKQDLENNGKEINVWRRNTTRAVE